MDKSFNEIIQQNTTLFQEVIKEKLTEGKTPMVIIFIGANNDIEQKLAKRVTKTHVQDIEKRSETCGSTTQ